MSKGLLTIFSEIANQYELVNHVLTFSLDIPWRKKASQIVAAGDSSVGNEESSLESIEGLINAVGSNETEECNLEVEGNHSDSGADTPCFTFGQHDSQS